MLFVVGGAVGANAGGHTGPPLHVPSTRSRALAFHPSYDVTSFEPRANAARRVALVDWSGSTLRRWG
jgi:hypothetical protein